MYYDFAPLEGITDDLFRRIHRKYYPGIHRYYTPFLPPVTKKGFTGKSLYQILPEYNDTSLLIPQLISAEPRQFLLSARRLRDLGYREVNLNLGCPYGTVTAKGKGSGALYPERRDSLVRLLDGIFADPVLPVSVKTRIGKTDGEEFPALLDLFNRYPISRLIVHPRTREDLYRTPVRMEWFAYAAAHSVHPLVLSGGIARVSDLARLEGSRPEGIMLGRGLVADPALHLRLQGQWSGTDPARFRGFHDELFGAVCDRLRIPRSILFRMKELWRYFILSFPDAGRPWRDLRKAATLMDYRSAVERIFSCPMTDTLQPDWP